MAWRNCYASDALIREINAMAPGRSKASDGTVGDLSHSARTSDHNPNAQGVVRARDITRAGLDLPALFERLRRMGAAGDPRLAGGGYLILDRRITTPDFRGWRAYSGSNPHVKHGHVSFSRNAAGFDSRAGWGLASGGSVAPAPSGGDPLVRAAQAKLKSAYKAYAGNLVVDGLPGPKTTAALREFQSRSGLPTSGVIDAATRAALRI